MGSNETTNQENIFIILFLESELWFQIVDVSQHITVLTFTDENCSIDTLKRIVNSYHSVNILYSFLG